MNYRTATEIPMYVHRRTLYRIVLIGLTISTPGILLDADHWWANIMGLENARWLHYSIASTPAVYLLLCVLWSLVATAFTVGWSDIIHPVQPQQEISQKLLPTLFLQTEVSEADAPQLDMPTNLLEVTVEEMTQE